MKGRVTALALAALSIAGLAFGQPQTASDSIPIRIHSLTLESATLPQTERDRISKRFQNHTYTLPELAERVRRDLETMGYFKAVVYDPVLSHLTERGGLQSADVSIATDEGLKYRVGEIKFSGGTVFSQSRMRESFPIKAGDIFDVSTIGEGLEALRKLYGSVGYINFTSVPDTHVSDQNRTIDILIDIDQGQCFRFGPLVLAGVEPAAGDGQALLKSYEKLRDTQFSPESLENWVRENRTHLPKGFTIPHSIELSPDSGTSLVTVRASL